MQLLGYVSQPSLLFVQEAYHAKKGVDKLDLDILNGELALCRQHSSWLTHLSIEFTSSWPEGHAAISSDMQDLLHDCSSCKLQVQRWWWKCLTTPT